MMNRNGFILLLILLLAGCAHERVLRVSGPYPDSPWIKRCLQYWTSNFSTNEINHFYVGAVRPRGGTDALVYWSEERTIQDYIELSVAVLNESGHEMLAWHHSLKLDRDTVDTEEDIGGSSYLITHRVWVDWMEGCRSRGREYVIPLEEARGLYPKETPDDK
jgi:hypothetical protein